MTKHVLTPLAERFWPKVERVEGEGCWRWLGATRAKGYGQISAGRRGAPPLKAHRVAWELAYGPVPPGLSVCHRCDNPPCCRPSHLYLGTNRDNTLDSFAKGRNDPAANGRKSAVRKGAARLAAQGQRGAQVRWRRTAPPLTEEDVRAIRAASAAGAFPWMLAGRYGVRPDTIRSIVSRKRWRRVP